MMLQGVSQATGNSDDGAAPDQRHETSAAAAGGASGAADVGSSGISEDERGRTEDGGRNSGGNRWPRQETLYLLKIRQEMDAAFRDSSLKGPLWDEVSRKLALLGFHRSAKKCKEKFENVYKYHKRIKEGRSSKSDGKTYKFFDQLEALEASPAAGNHNQPPLSLPPPPPVVSKPPQVSPMPNPQAPSIPPVVTPLSMTVVDPISVAAPAVAMPAMNINQAARFPFSNMSASTDLSDSSTSSDDEPPERRQNRKRKWKEFFGRLMKEVIDKQEELQSKFIETLERRERDQMAREEARRMQEMAKMKQEHELLLQERSMVAAKDAAVITFLQKITEQNLIAGIPQIPAMQLLQQQQQNQPAPTATPAPPPPQTTPQSQPQPQPQSQAAPPPLAVPIAAPATPVSVPTPAPPPPAVKNQDNGGGGGGESMLQPSPSRWPKAEINALIQIRTSLDTKYQESGPKGPLWEEVSAEMRNLGYNRNAKRCKEKWENINKYYKKVKESSKKRPEDSKTCTYFHQLDAIYREKASSSSNNNNIPGFTVKPETGMAPIMARPEQQWPLVAAVQEQHHHQHHQYHHHQQLEQQSKVSEQDHRNADLNDDDYDDDEDEDDDDEEDEEGGAYEVVPNKTSSMAAVE